MKIKIICIAIALGASSWLVSSCGPPGEPDVPEEGKPIEPLPPRTTAR